MGFYSIAVIFYLFMMTGCAATQPGLKQAFSQGYREAAKVQMEQIVQQFNGNDFPYFYWTQPLVQEVEIPAHISNGVFIAQHKELVMIKPGEWKKSPAYPITHQENDNESHQTVSPSLDITALPSQRQ